MNNKSQIQLELIKEITRMFQHSNIPHWLFGGWAIDFYVGRVTREHRDIDFVIWDRDKTVAQHLLSVNGYTEKFQSIETGKFDKNGESVELEYIVRRSDGKIIIPGKWSDWPWADGAFDAPIVQLLGVACPVTSLQSILETKEGFIHHVCGGQLRDKDVADIALLHSVL